MTVAMEIRRHVELAQAEASAKSKAEVLLFLVTNIGMVSSSKILPTTISKGGIAVRLVSLRHTSSRQSWT